MFLMDMKHLFVVVVLVLFAYDNSTCRATTSHNQSEFITLMKKSFSENSPFLTSWEGSSYCNYAGISCDGQENIVQLDISGWSLHGKFPDQVCSYLPRLRVLRIGDNNFDGEFPHGVLNCTFLEELNMSSIYFTGSLPDFSPLEALRVIDLSYNYFSGNFPLSITHLSNLEALNFNENEEFNFWQLPENISRLVNLRYVVLTSCMLSGEIPPSVGNMTSLIDLELSGNYLSGRIPKELGLLKNLRQLELYYNEFVGEIPDELGNLTQLTDLDMSANRFSGNIPEYICQLPNLRLFQLYNNSLTGEIPAAIANSTTLKTFSLYANFLTGQVPQNLGRSSALLGVDLSENKFSGRLPEQLCAGGKLNYLLLLENLFSGEIPQSYAECKSLIRFRVSSNNLEGKLPQGMLSLPHASIIDVGYNHLSGSIPSGIQNAKNLSELLMQGNRLSGVIPSDISLATSLVKIDLSNNLLSGPIPSGIGNLRLLNLLLLQGNELNSSIPESLSSLKSLNLLDLSSNCLTGNIPESLSKLLPNSLNFSNNQLSGPIPVPFIKGGVLESLTDNPGLCIADSSSSTSRPRFPVCSQPHNQRAINFIWLIVISVGIVILAAVLFLKRWFGKDNDVTENEENTQSSSFFSYDVKSFHRLSFDQREIIEAMNDKNIVGYGGSGTVYKIELNSGGVVAAKKLWSRNAKDASSASACSEEDQLLLDKELKTEVETLGCIRHKNIVKLYCYFSSLDCSLLIYEYMPNGNLWDALHHRSWGKVVVDWPTRHQIALGIAQGLAYLHHDLMPPIVHRDIKSTNILLDIDYQAKVADFGIAKVLQARGTMDSTTTVIAGTYGYLAPEYAYSCKATTKCDVYSFGVVLMEIITGKKPVEAEFGENRNIIYWVRSKFESEEGAMEVLDKRAASLFEDEMIKVLQIAIRCTCTNPMLRPTMNEVVQLLIEADPCRFDCCNHSTNDAGLDVTKPKNPYE